ncbi:hypothetical protein AJ79_02384 [Helicocarpus griseus UAMH5409]|uniref:Non-reducing polyketide synthase nscA n=1 Tax=Helicocarpus griseus UAMH5409 TaxID=1447875 RepID=A0A2B7Y3K5_9EURO|nr:hypothetical protein AJ79_02384 [Helicocarpus griseus UAMH5409]
MDVHTTGHEDVFDAKDYALPPIAIVGLSMRLPGGVNCADGLWDLLVNKNDGLCSIPESRYTRHSSTGPRSFNPQRGYFLQEDPGYFDAKFFSISRSEAAKLDSQQRLLFEVVWECLENGGQTSRRGKDIGCFVGVFTEDWLELSLKDVQSIDRYHVHSTRDFVLSNRLSYEFDFKGPSITFKTACSSSLVGLHEACQSLYSGDCSAAVVAGVNLILSPTKTSSMVENILAKDGICKTFDANADGYGRGEAVNAIFIKKLDNALKDGDPIRAVIRSTAVNSSGRGQALACPDLSSQRKLIDAAYKKARIQDLSKTAFVECHGTGTKRGDITEITAIASVFEEGVFVGAVKPNVGHSEGAAGLTSVIKAVLALERKIIPPNTHFHDPNSKIPFEAAKLTVPVQPTSWPEGCSERVSVNCFGVGGMNAHVILDSAASVCGSKTVWNIPVNHIGEKLLVVSASTAMSLQRRIKSLEKYIESRPTKLQDLAYTLGVKREHLTHRGFIVADKQSMITLDNFRTAQSSPFPGLTFCFTGQGSQYPEMGKGLMEFERFRNDIREMDKILRSLKDPPAWSIEDELFKPAGVSQVEKAEFAQLLCTAIQIAMVNLLSSWGINPDSVAGHSSGEIAAAYASGAVPLRTALCLSYYRGHILSQVSKRGSMAAVGLGISDVTPYLESGVVVACKNSPQSVTLSGDIDALERTLSKLQLDHPGVFYRHLRVKVAFHSDHMKEIGALYERLIEPQITYNESMIPMLSTVHGKVISAPNLLSAEYWRQNLELPVLFHGAVNALLENNDHNRVFLEIGPHSTLSGPLKQISRVVSAITDWNMSLLF